MPTPMPLVLIPALLCDDALYRDVIAGLGDRVAPQVMMSPRPTLAESVADILGRAPPEFVLAGTSYGASLALEVALAAPERVQGLWLMGCDPGAPDHEQSLGIAGMIEGQTEAATAHLATLVVRPEHTEAAETFKAMAGRVGGKAGSAEMRALATREAVWDRLGELTMPVLVLWGAEDALVPVAVGRKLADTLPHAHFHALAECGHLPTLEKPAEVAELVGAWLDEDMGHSH